METVAHETDVQTQKLSWAQHLLIAWPLVLAVFGGAIGLLFGGLAYFINYKVYGSPLSKMNKVLANLLCGMAAMSGWWFTAQWIQASF